MSKDKNEAPLYQGKERRVIVGDIHWHQTKSLSLSIIGLLLVNIVSTVWWAATLTSDVAQFKQRPDLLERVIKLETLTAEYNGGLGRLIDLIDKLERKIDKQSGKVYRIDREQSRRKDSIHIHKEK